MRNMSFAMTKKQILNKSKTVTRRFGWWFVNPGLVFQPVEKCMGLKPGEKMVKLGNPIIVVDARHEPLNSITPEDVILEGFPGWTPDQFIAMLVKHYKLKTTDRLVNRIEFDYLNDDGTCINPRCSVCWKKIDIGQYFNFDGGVNLKMNKEIYSGILSDPSGYISMKHKACKIPEPEKLEQ